MERCLNEYNRSHRESGSVTTCSHLTHFQTNTKKTKSSHYSIQPFGKLEFQFGKVKSGIWSSDWNRHAIRIRCDTLLGSLSYKGQTKCSSSSQSRTRSRQSPDSPWTHISNGMGKLSIRRQLKHYRWAHSCKEYFGRSCFINHNGMELFIFLTKTSHRFVSSFGMSKRTLWRKGPRSVDNETD